MREKREDTAGEEEASAESRAPALGWLCAYTPEELVLASGFTPLRLKGCEERPPQDSLLPSNLCPYVRSVLDEAKAEVGRKLDAVSFVASCDAMRRLSDAWKMRFPGVPVHVLDSPRRRDPAAHTYLVSQYRAFLDFLSRVSGRRPLESEIRESVALVNRKRTLLTRLSDLRKEDPPGMTGSKFSSVVSASWSLGPEAFLDRYEHLVPGKAGAGPRLVVTGSIIENENLFEAVEKAGANIVAEDICTGLRSICGLVEEAGSPLESIASRYLARPACSRMSGIAQRASHLLGLVHDYRAQGVIFHSLKFCDQYQYDYPLIKRMLEEKGIPVMKIETDYQEGTRGQLATRLEAFTEVLARAAHECREGEYERSQR